MGSIAHQVRVIHSCIKKKRDVRHNLSAGTVFRFTTVENLQRGKKTTLRGFLVCQTN
jgi:hypothetical protein